jgi:glycosyltransferase involved in cell wall biosynthesis
MTVLHIINTLGPGGAERLVSDLSVWFREHKIDIYVYVLKSIRNDFFRNDLIKEGINLTYSERKSFTDIRHIADIVRYARKIGADIIHAHLSYSVYYAAISSFFLKKRTRLVYTEHSTSNRRRGKFYFKISDRIVASRYSKIICISKEAELFLNMWLENTKNKSVTINNGINLDKFKGAEDAGLRKTYNLPADAKIILNVGSLSRNKNQKLLIRAVCHAGGGYILFIAGQGPLESELKKEVIKLGIEKQVFFLGVRKDVESLYKSSDLLVLCSRWEGFGLVAVEAMAAGVPVLVSNIPGLSGVTGEGGFTFEPDDLEDLVSKIKMIFNDPLRTNQKRLLALSRAEMFSMNKMAREYINLYHSILQGDE